MNKNFVKIIFVVMLFGGMFFVGGNIKAQSSNNCCVTSEAKLGGSTGTSYNESELKDISCKFTTSGSCGGVKTTECRLPSGQYSEKDGYGNCVDKTAERYINYTTGPYPCADRIICKKTLLGANCSEQKNETSCSELSTACFWSTNLQDCFGLNDINNCPGFNKADCARVEACTWEPPNDPNGSCLNPLLKGVTDRYGGTENRGLFRGCAFSGTCRNLSDILYTVLKIVNEIFKYIGAIAFIFFVYGGFTMILSFGNAEKFKKGQQVLVAAVIGLVIVFGAYLMITFVLEALGVSAEFKAIK